MATNVVDFKIKVDGKELDLTKTSLNQFKEVYSETQKKLNDLPLGSPEWKKLNTELKNADTAFQQTKDTLNETEGKFKSLRLQIRQATIAFQEAEEKGDMDGMKKAKKNLDDLGDQLEITTLKSMKFEDALATMPGVAGLVGQSIQGVDKAFKVLVANPILAVVTAVVGAFMFLKEALSKTSEGQAALNKVQQAFSKILGPILALINTVAIPIFETLATIIEKVAGAFAFFAEKLGVSKESIAKATKDIDEVGKEAAENEKKRQEDAAAAAEKEAARKKEAADKAKAAFEAEKKRQQDLIKSNEDLEQSVIELIRAKIKASEDPIVALKEEQKVKDEDYAREKKRLEDLKKVKGTTAEEQKQLTIELNNLEATYSKDKIDRDVKLVEENKKKVKALMDDEIDALNLRNAKGELTEDKYQSQLYAIQKKYTTDKKELNDIEIANEQYKTNQKKAIEDDERSRQLNKLQNQMNDLDKKNELLEFDFQQDLERLAEKRLKLDEAEKLELAAVENNEIERNKILQKYSDQRKAIDQQEVNTVKAAEEAKYQIKLTYLQAAQAFGSLLQSIAGENKKLAIAGLLIEKASALAIIAISAKKNFIKDGGITSPMAIANLIGAGVAALAVVAAAIKGVNDINKSGSGSGDAGAAPATTPNMGRNYEKGGLLNGPRHAQGGMMIEAEGGEAIMTRGAVTMFAPMLSAMNQMGGGTSFGNQLFIRPDAAAVEKPQQEQSPVIMKTYVVSNELTTESEKLARLKDLSTL